MTDAAPRDVELVELTGDELAWTLEEIDRDGALRETAAAALAPHPRG
jgi:hypothetical protein